MDAREERVARLLSAVEDLAAQERATVQAHDFAALTSVQNRLAPLIEHLAAQGNEVREHLLQERVQAIHALRRETGDRLASEIRRIGTELKATEHAQLRTAQIAPVYRAAGSTMPTSPRLAFVG
jgi:hypothetical protein